MKIDENGNPVPGPTSILPPPAAASYGRYDDEDEPLDS